MYGLARRLSPYELTVAAVLQPYRATRPHHAGVSGLWDALVEAIDDPLDGSETHRAAVVDLDLQRRLRR